MGLDPSHVNEDDAGDVLFRPADELCSPGRQERVRLDASNRLRAGARQWSRYRGSTVAGHQGWCRFIREATGLGAGFGLSGSEVAHRAIRPYHHIELTLFFHLCNDRTGHDVFYGHERDAVAQQLADDPDLDEIRVRIDPLTSPARCVGHIGCDQIPLGPGYQRPGLDPREDLENITMNEAMFHNASLNIIVILLSRDSLSLCSYAVTL